MIHNTVVPIKKAHRKSSDDVQETSLNVTSTTLSGKKVQVLILVSKLNQNLQKNPIMRTN
jgi:hypothetical protein